MINEVDEHGVFVVTTDIYEEQNPLAKVMGWILVIFSSIAIIMVGYLYSRVYNPELVDIEFPEQKYLMARDTESPSPRKELETARGEVDLQDKGDDNQDKIVI